MDTVHKGCLLLHKATSKVWPPVTAVNHAIVFIVINYTKVILMKYTTQSCGCHLFCPLLTTFSLLKTLALGMGVTLRCDGPMATVVPPWL